MIVDRQHEGGVGRAAGKEYLTLGAAGGSGLMAGRGTPDRPAPAARHRIVTYGTKTEQLDNRYGSLRRRPGAVGWRSRVIDHDASKSLLPSTDPDRTSFAIEKGGWNPVNRIALRYAGLPTRGASETVRRCQCALINLTQPLAPQRSRESQVHRRSSSPLSARLRPRASIRQDQSNTRLGCSGQARRAPPGTAARHGTRANGGPQSRGWLRHPGAQSPAPA